MKKLVFLISLFISIIWIAYAYERGDANGNGKIDIFDALNIAEYLAGLKTKDQLPGFSDIDANNNTRVDIFDALYVAERLAGLRNNNYELADGATGNITIQKPTTPAGLKAVAGDAQVVLSWSTVSGASSYKLYRGGVLLASPTTASYTDTGLTNGTAYSYTVAAVNSAGESAVSSAVTATPVVGLSSAAPLVSMDLYFCAANISWPNTSNNYNVYYSHSSNAWNSTWKSNAGMSKISVSANCYQLMLQEDTDYYLGVTAVGDSGVESGCSEVFCFVPPPRPYNLQGDYLVLDLSKNGEVTYTTQDTLDVTDVKYKKTYIALKRIRAGTFVMGSSTEKNAQPAHTVTLTKDYYIGIYEITNQQYKAIQGSCAYPSKYPPKGYDLDTVAAYKISWQDARGGYAGKIGAMHNSFMGRMTSLSGLKCDLPTEAQWEYACRAGGSTTSGSLDLERLMIPDKGWYYDNSSVKWTETGIMNITYTYSLVQTVGKKAANSWGLFDMNGNVAEWVCDTKSDYSSSPQTDPVVMDPFAFNLDNSYRVYRGGSYRSTSVDDCMAGARFGQFQGDRILSENGIRMVVEASQLKEGQKLSAPVTPTGLTATAGDAQVNLTWSVVSGASRYKLYRGGVLVATTIRHSYTNTGLTNGTLYSYTVSALNSAGESVVSAEVTATPQLSAPTGLTATAGYVQVNLTWSVVSGASSYKLYRGGVLLASPTTASYTDTDLTNGVLYSYTVSAVNSAGESVVSAAVTAKLVSTATYSGDYAIIDVSGGASATSYPVSYTSTKPTLSNENITSKIILRWIPAGNFMMGSPEEELGRSTGETQHSVTLTAGFYMGVYEVTQAQYEAVMGSNPSSYSGKPGNPVEKVSWNDIRGGTFSGSSGGSASSNTFMGKIASKTSLRFDLPTEAQWEYACRAGTTTALNSGNNLTSISWDFAMRVVGKHGDKVGAIGASGHALVGSYAANAWGLYDMHGNVYEWCLDWYSTYSSSSVSNPTGAYSNTSAGRVLRGGSWSSGAQYCRSASRDGKSPDSRSNTVGFRLALPAEPATPTGLTVITGDTQVNLTWSMVSGASSYKLYRGGVLLASPTTASYTDTGLTNGTAYSYTVSSVNSAGESAVSSAVTATPQLSAPTGLTATAGNTQVVLSWSVVSGASSYRLYRGGVFLASPTTNSYTNTGLTNGTVYSYTVAAWTSAGASAVSAEVMATPKLSAPVTPTGFTATAGDTMVVLSWSAVSGANIYKIYRGDALVASLTTTSYTNTGLTNGVLYSYTVAAVNSAGESAVSAAVTATPVLTATYSGDYAIIDVTGGANATSYPVSYTCTKPTLSDEYKTNKIILRWIPAGNFMMGSPVGELGRGYDETQHSVTLTSGFYMGVYEVTQAQYIAVMGRNPSSYSGNTRPAERVSWEDVRGGTFSGSSGGLASSNTFMGKIASKTSLTFDLPTEAQWEYACRAGTTTALNSGNNLTSTGQDAAMDVVGRYYYNQTSGVGGYTSGHTAVGSYAANAWGLYDMHGNVSELCLDWSGVSPSSNSVSNPMGATTGSYRVRRGGGWNNYAQDCRSAYRGVYVPSNRDYYVGFRLALPAGQ